LIQKAKSAERKRKTDLGDNGNPKGKRSAKVKDKSAPVTGRTAFAFFQQHVRNAVLKRLQTQLGVEKVDNKLIMAKMGHLWHVLDDERKEVFNKVHLLDIERYEADKVKYEKNDYVGAIKDDDGSASDNDDVDEVSADDSASSKKSSPVSSSSSSSSSQSSSSSSHKSKKAKKGR
jgi:hypothetical protein